MCSNLAMNTVTNSMDIVGVSFRNIKNIQSIDLCFYLKWLSYVMNMMWQHQRTFFKIDMDCCFVSSHSATIHLFKSNNINTTRKWKILKITIKYQNDVIDFVLASMLLTLNRSHKLFWYFKCCIVCFAVIWSLFIDAAIYSCLVE